MNNINLWLWVFFSAIIQLALMPFFSVGGITADLFLICVVFLSVEINHPIAFGIVLFCALLRDVMGIGVIGISCLVYPILFFVLNGIRHSLVINTGRLFSLIVLLISLGASLLERFFAGILGFRIINLTYFTVSFFQALYTALLTELFMQFTKKFRH
ncbi:MAG: rod shape-determining protein MreD [Candidatus Omnitrophica bacterium]|nr:rod shape-determining protein MreD [Candidatus Omnitrophota bacterium]